jgi:hypothetical protein
MTRSAKIMITVLFVLVLLSLGLNGLLLWQWWSFQRRVEQTIQEVQPVLHEAISQAITDLEAFEQTPLEFDVKIDQEFPIETEISVNDSLEFPIQTTVPIKQDIETTVLLDPFQSGLEIPTDITVPVDIEVPLDLNVPVHIDESVPISTVIPVNLTVPLSIDVRETELGPYLQRLRQGLASFDQTLLDLEP